MPKHSVFIARFPYHGDEKHTVTDWLVRTALQMKQDPRVGDIFHKTYDDTPITMTRNAACLDARKARADFILMVDNDMAPDLREPGAKPFWQTSFDFALEHAGPCIVGAPYCGPPPQELVYIFRWVQSDQDQPAGAKQFRLEMCSREDAAFRSGMEEVAALPTGLMLMPVSVLDRVALPWFDYEWADQYRARKATTEDVYFTRNASLAGVPLYVNWDAWAGHWKQKVVTRPRLLTKDAVADELRQALLRPGAGERIIDVPAGGI